MFTIKTKHQTNTRIRSKKIKLSFLISIIVLSLISCEKEKLNKEPNENENAVEFTSAINDFIIEFAKTRAVGNSWHKHDTIGIFAINAQQELSEESIYNDYSNIKYVNTSAGEVGAFSAVDNKIMLPVNDQTFDFIAYYPYTPDVTGFTFPIDITIQEPRTDINIMYATSKGHTSDSSDVKFVFDRVLSSILIQLTSNEGISLQGATITIENANTNATLNLVDGDVSVGDEKNSITPIIEYDTINNQLTTIATLMPGQNLRDIEIKINLANGNNYTWTPEEHVLTSKVTRCYTINLTYEDVELISSGSTINGWEEDIDDTVHVLKPDSKDVTEDPDETGDPDPTEPDDGNPDDGVDPKDPTNPDDPANPDEENPDPVDLGDGTKENPYTVKQAIATQDKKEKWVEGYIVGFLDLTEKIYISDDFFHKDAAKSIVLADKVIETDEELYFPIPLDSSAPLVKESLNLRDNRFLSRKIKILCTLRQYMGFPGGSNVNDYELLPVE